MPRILYTFFDTYDLSGKTIAPFCTSGGSGLSGTPGTIAKLDEEHSREIIKHGLELGVNFFDTAISYQSGTSEQYLGRALRDHAERDEVVVATKFLPRTQEDIEAGITGQQHIERMINKSPENLGMDHVDLYIYHIWDHQTPLYDIMEGLNDIVKAGKVRYIGISNCFAWQLAKANALAEREGFAKFVSIQGHYNLIFREEEREMAKLCAEDNIAMTPYSALAGGRLSKAPGETSKRLEEDSYARSKYDATAGQDGMIIGRVMGLAEKHGVSMTEISLAWLLSKVTAPVVGATKPHHIEGAAKAAKGPAFARRLHILGSYWGFLLMSLHLGLHWNAVLGMVKKKSLFYLDHLSLMGTRIFISHYVGRSLRSLKKKKCG